MNDKKNRAGANLPHGDVPILFLIMGSVLNRQGVWVVKDKRSRLEIHVVYGEIVLVLLLIVLESHDLTQHKITRCTYSCQYTCVRGHKKPGRHVHAQREISSPLISIVVLLLAFFYSGFS